MAKPTVDEVRFAVDGGTFADAVNISAPASGLKNTGYADSAIPTAKNINYLFNKGYRWDRWVAAQLDDVTTLKQAFVVSDTGAAAAVQAQLAAGSAMTMTLQSLRVGDTIVAVRMRLKDVTPTSKAQFKIYSMLDGVMTDGGAPPTPLATSAKSAGNATKQTINLSGLAIVVASLTDYVITITETDGTGTIDLYCVEVDVQRPVTP